MSSKKITLDLKVFDDEGNVVDGTTVDLTREQISMIIDHASQLILHRRDNKLNDMNDVLDELDSVLTETDVIENLDSSIINQP